MYGIIKMQKETIIEYVQTKLNVQKQIINMSHKQIIHNVLIHVQQILYNYYLLTKSINAHKVNIVHKQTNNMSQLRTNKYD